MSNLEIPIACDLSALADRARHEAVGAKLLSQALSVTAIDTGYQIEFPVTALLLVAEFIDGERRCCPFFHFMVQIAPSASTVQVQLAGRDGVKAFLESELLPLLPVAPER